MCIPEECNFLLLDEDLKLKLLNDLKQLQLQYEANKKKLIQESLQVQTHRNQHQNTNTVAESCLMSTHSSLQENAKKACSSIFKTDSENAIAFELGLLNQIGKVDNNAKELSAVVGQENFQNPHSSSLKSNTLRRSLRQNNAPLREKSLSPVLQRKPSLKKRRQNTRKFFPKLPIACLKLLTSTIAFEDFFLPESFFIENVVKPQDLKQDEKCKALVNASACDSCFLEKIYDKKQICKISLMISCTHHYLAVASNSFCVKIYVKMSSDWMEAWRIDSEESFDDIHWMATDANTSFEFLIRTSLTCACIWLSQFDYYRNEQIVNVCQLNAPGLTSLVILPDSQLVTFGNEIQKYSFNHAEKFFHKESVLMPVDEKIESASTVNHQPRALIGCSTSRFYLWNHSSGSLLRQFDLQFPQQKFLQIFSIASLQGALLCRVLIERNKSHLCCSFIVNPFTGKSSSAPDQAGGDSQALLHVFDNSSNRQCIIPSFSRIASLLKNFPLREFIVSR